MMVITVLPDPDKSVVLSVAVQVIVADLVTPTFGTISARLAPGNAMIPEAPVDTDAGGAGTPGPTELPLNVN